MFQLFKKKSDAKMIIAAPVKGKAIAITQVNDPAFSEKMLGDGAAIIPEDGKIVAPFDGEVSLLFDTLHAVSLTSEQGIELLIHVGLDTVTLKGNGFIGHVKNGDKVKKGDLLISADLEAIKSKGLDTVTVLVVCNTDDYEEIALVRSDSIEPGEDFLAITKK